MWVSVKKHVSRFRPNIDENHAHWIAHTLPSITNQPSWTSHIESPGIYLHSAIHSLTLSNSIEEGRAEVLGMSSWRWSIFLLWFELLISRMRQPLYRQTTGGTGLFTHTKGSTSALLIWWGDELRTKSTSFVVNQVCRPRLASFTCPLSMYRIEARLFHFMRHVQRRAQGHYILGSIRVSSKQTSSLKCLRTRTCSFTAF